MSFGFKSAGHFFSVAFSDLKKALKATETVVLPNAQTVIKEAEVVTAAIAVVIPQANTALVIERALDAAAGELLAALNTVDVATGASLVNVSFDAAVVTTFKQFIESQKTVLEGLGYKL